MGSIFFFILPHVQRGLTIEIQLTALIQDTSKIVIMHSRKYSSILAALCTCLDPSLATDPEPPRINTGLNLRDNVDPLKRISDLCLVLYPQNSSYK